MPSKKVLVVLTSTSKYPGLNKPTGLWLAEAVHFVEKIKNAGFEIDYVSPQGGYIPIDPTSLAAADELDYSYYTNKSFMDKLGCTKTPSDVTPSDYSVIYFTGGHGTVYDFPDNSELQELSRVIYESGGIVSSVCHGAVGLLNIKLSDGKLLIGGKKVTGFSNEEEKMIGLDTVVPFLTETEMVAKGGIFSKSSEAWGVHVVSDQRVVTGQNPASAAKVAEEVISMLRAL
mmetsp:Transcript_1790/g.2372  ORF Transcript_1790/g.2372 Transcript_1790/m.2372 type:complete len:230 (-) Transcript_1790:25-714(-)|eukprot:CAMPEP_0171476898 /NCGR_PEP_ID=MMETSP0946-20130122/3866_1 /TAXON_ID=109269 /ORGANISM="Vaucheria litorea, Strain CCMP2940" /LENGTH=229 /DNA_ID=CAMNT_0012007251 /DNA_START=33 /DNA_END=722 /DNA_ORIENTATION=-